MKANLPLLANILGHADFLAGDIHTRWLDETLAALATPDPTRRARIVAPPAGAPVAAGSAGARAVSCPLYTCRAADESSRVLQTLHLTLLVHIIT